MFVAAYRTRSTSRDSPVQAFKAHVATLGGQLFSFTNAPNRSGLPAFYELHVWAWRDNPTGVFSDMNPTVSCAGAPMEMK